MVCKETEELRGNANGHCEDRHNAIYKSAHAKPHFTVESELSQIMHINDTHATANTCLIRQFFQVAFQRHLNLKKPAIFMSGTEQKQRETSERRDGTGGGFFLDRLLCSICQISLLSKHMALEKEECLAVM